MRIFHLNNLSSGCHHRFNTLNPRIESYAEGIERFLEFGHEIVHILKPGINRDPSFFISLGNCDSLQKLWATEHGRSTRTPSIELILNQIEHHGADIVYSFDPTRYGNAFVRRLPGCVKKTIAWYAGPKPPADLGVYDLVVNNFPKLRDSYKQLGCRVAAMFPAPPESLYAFATSQSRPIDVLFSGAYGRHHRRRAQILKEIIRTLPGRFNVQFYLETSRFSKYFDNSLFRSIGLLQNYVVPNNFKPYTSPAIYGNEMYQVMARSKVVVNVAGEVAGGERGNMRCFEAMACGTLMVSDAGTYPEGMVAGVTHLEYTSAEEAVDVIRKALADFNTNRIPDAALKLMADRFNKDRQWAAFKALL
jgi:Glycosyl transferases group 1